MPLQTSQEARNNGNFMSAQNEYKFQTLLFIIDSYSLLYKMLFANCKCLAESGMQENDLAVTYSKLRIIKLRKAWTFIISLWSIQMLSRLIPTRLWIEGAPIKANQIICIGASNLATFVIKNIYAQISEMKKCTAI